LGSAGRSFRGSFARRRRETGRGDRSGWRRLGPLSRGAKHAGWSSDGPTRSQSGPAKVAESASGSQHLPARPSPKTRHGCMSRQTVG
jgi:hypothetical protein